ncbi:hypothetical protein B0G80_6039 [Paraburkholderia sp. BL6669N2]|nr:hypothetical protein B0G80_6039 [Paraburkholderia sp. BL6669N2]
MKLRLTHLYAETRCRWPEEPRLWFLRVTSMLEWARLVSTVTMRLRSYTYMETTNRLLRRARNSSPSCARKQKVRRFTSWRMAKESLIACVSWVPISAPQDHSRSKNMIGPRFRKAARLDVSLSHEVGRDIHEPADRLRSPERTLQWLNRRLDKPFAGQTVVVTYYAPGGMSVPQSHRRRYLGGAFANGLEALAIKADYWIHGHIHRSADYNIGTCRVICNPRGYPFRSQIGHYRNIPVK